MMSLGDNELICPIFQAVRISEDQKLHFRSNLEDLRLQLQQVMSNRDQVLQIR